MNKEDLIEKQRQAIRDASSVYDIIALCIPDLKEQMRLYAYKSEGNAYQEYRGTYKEVYYQLWDKIALLEQALTKEGYTDMHPDLEGVRVKP